LNVRFIRQAARSGIRELLPAQACAYIVCVISLTDAIDVRTAIVAARVTETIKGCGDIEVVARLFLRSATCADYCVESRFDTLGFIWGHPATSAWSSS